METGYIVVCTTYLSGDSAKALYGIAHVQYADGECVILRTVPDVTNDKKKIERLVSHCNELCLDPIHLKYVAEDLAAEL